MGGFLSNEQCILPIFIAEIFIIFCFLSLLKLFSRGRPHHHHQKVTSLPHHRPLMIFFGELSFLFFANSDQIYLKLLLKHFFSESSFKPFFHITFFPFHAHHKAFCIFLDFFHLHFNIFWIHRVHRGIAKINPLNNLFIL